MNWFTRVRNSIGWLPKRTSEKDLWVKCPSCQEMLFEKEYEENLHVCPRCGHHGRINADQRLALLLDEGLVVALLGDEQVGKNQDQQRHGQGNRRHQYPRLAHLVRALFYRKGIEFIFGNAIVLTRIIDHTACRQEHGAFENTMGKAIEKIPQKSMDALQRYHWPGNIRELKNVIENAMIISNDRILKLKPLADLSLNLQKDFKLEAVERNHIIDVLNKTSWRVSGQKGAADLLGLKPTTLESRMKNLGITRPK